MPPEFRETTSDEQKKLSQEEDVEYKRKYRCGNTGNTDVEYKRKYRCGNTGNTDVEYKRKYRELKRTLKNGVSKNEYLKSELRHSQKKLQVHTQKII